MSSNTKSAGPLPPPAELDQLTIGIEMEFLLIYPDGGPTSAFDEDDMGMGHVVKALEESSFTKHCSQCGRNHEYSLPLSSDLDAEADEVTNLWTVTGDLSVLLPWAEQEKIEGPYHVKGVEVRSRALYYDRPTPCGHDDHHGGEAEHMWQLELETVLNALHQLGGREDFRVFVNPSAGFHVHVGNGNQGINTAAARNLMGIFTAFERQFDSINTTPRIGGGGMGRDHVYPSLPDPPGSIRTFDYESSNRAHIQEDNGAFCQPISAMHNYNVESNVYPAENPLRSRKDIAAWLQLIQQCRTAESLKNIAGNGRIPWHNHLFNIARLWDAATIAADDTGLDMEIILEKPTIEFRSHAATLDFAEQVSWIHVVALLTKFCYRYPEDQIFQSLQQAWMDYDFRFVDLLQIIGADAQLMDFYRGVTGDRGYTPLSLIRAEQHVLQELGRSDDIRRTELLLTNAHREWRYRNADAVKQKIRNKFYQGMYGRFPEQFVVRFLTEQGDLGAYERGEAEYLILRE